MGVLSTPAAEWSWKEMLGFFRALGGVAENLEFRAAPAGGLFPVDESQPVLLRVPPALLFSVNDIAFEDNKMRLRDTANVGEAERLFFEKYQTAFSWGGTAGAESRAFVAALDRLPSEIGDLLASDFGFEFLLEGEPELRARSHFLASRTIGTAEAEILAPILDLADHDTTGFACEYVQGLQIAGHASGEIFRSHGVHDALSGFMNWGTAFAQPGAFSLPLRAEWNSREMLIGRDLKRSMMHGKAWVPEMRVDANRVKLSYLMIGHRRLPRLSRGIFRALMREAELSNPNELFDQILYFNWSKILQLLALLEPYEGEQIETLRRTARYQLEAISHCVGSREVEQDQLQAEQSAPADAAPAEQVWQISIQ